MQPKNFVALAGFIMLIAATWCPLLRPFGIIHWNLYGLNKPYGVVVLVIAVAGAFAVLLLKRSVARMAAWSSLVLVLLVYIAAWLKVHTSFSFLPFRSLAGYLTGLITFQWGWYLLFAGPLLSILGLTTKRRNRPVA